MTPTPRDEGVRAVKRWYFCVEQQEFVDEDGDECVASAVVNARDFDALLRERDQLKAENEAFRKERKERGEMVRWIPIGERLPKRNGTYPVTTASSLFLPDIEAREFRDGVFLRPNLAEVTAWLDVGPYDAALSAAGEGK